MKLKISTLLIIVAIIFFVYYYFSYMPCTQGKESLDNQEAAEESSTAMQQPQMPQQSQMPQQPRLPPAQQPQMPPVTNLAPEESSMEESFVPTTPINEFDGPAGNFGNDDYTDNRGTTLI